MIKSKFYSLVWKKVVYLHGVRVREWGCKNEGKWDREWGGERENEGGGGENERLSFEWTWSKENQNPWHNEADESIMLFFAKKENV